MGPAQFRGLFLCLPLVAEMKDHLLVLARKRLLEEFFKYVQENSRPDIIISAMFLLPEFKRFIRDTYHPGSLSMDYTHPTPVELVYCPETIHYVETLISTSIGTVETIYWAWINRQQYRANPS